MERNYHILEGASGDILQVENEASFTSGSRVGRTHPLVGRAGGNDGFEAVPGAGPHDDGTSDGAYRARPTGNNMKDISTVRYQPRRLWEWARIAMEEVERYA